ncbi:MAG: ATP-dependent DNA ligase, partial [Bradyrhizobium sp.]|nr:ATP-dependent DNA ligase [Bradyrhizobium sp.]
MNRFAQLLDRLAYEPGRNNKLRLLTSYFRETDDPDRGYALAALTGALSFRHAKPGLIRNLIADRTDPVLFALSYDYVGDLSETVALMWPKAASSPLPPRALARGGQGSGVGGVSASSLPEERADRPPTPDPSPPLASAFAKASADKPLAEGGEKIAPGHNNPPPPTLTEVVTTLRTLGKTELPKQLSRWLDELDETGRWALLKLVTGAMRIGISARLAKTAAAA